VNQVAIMEKQALALTDVAEVMERAATARDLQAVYAAVDALAQRVIGHRLLTVLRYLPETVEVERVYSSNTAAYPLAGRKRKQGTLWGEAVLDRGEVYIAADAAAVRAAFSDHALIASLGISSIMNIPIRFGSRVLGTMNLNHEAGHFGAQTVAPAKIMGGLLVPLLLAAEGA
jgi:GAF domain-containing protein